MQGCGDLFAPRLATAGLFGKRADRWFVLRLGRFVRGAGAGFLRFGFWLLVVSFRHETSFLLGRRDRVREKLTARLRYSPRTGSVTAEDSGFLFVSETRAARSAARIRASRSARI